MTCTSSGIDAHEGDAGGDGHLDALAQVAGGRDSGQIHERPDVIGLAGCAASRDRPGQ